MPGDRTRMGFSPHKRRARVLQQQGRIQLDADWNVAAEIAGAALAARTLDAFGPAGAPQLTTPDGFKIGILAGPPGDLSIERGRYYVDGQLAEIFPDETFTYLSQPFLPAPPPLPAGDAVVYLDIWEREVDAVIDPDLLDPALGGVDTVTHVQTVWQVKVEGRAGAACGMAVGQPASAGRLTTAAVAPPAPTDPCIVPPLTGYRGLENRLYRVEIQRAGPLGTALFKWSRDNGAIVSAVTDMVVAGARTTLTVARLGRDQMLRFLVGGFVTVTDDHRELMGEAGEMARVVDIDEANSALVLDRALPTAGWRAFGASAQLADRHTRVQRWDQTATLVPLDGDGLLATGAGPIPLEDGIEISFDVSVPGGQLNLGDSWSFWARTANASIEVLNRAPPKAIIHHYSQLAAATGLGGPAAAVSDCRPVPPAAPPAGEGKDCCCTMVVRPGESIQAAIDTLPPQGGCVCLKTGVHRLRTALKISRGSLLLKGESPGTIVRIEAPEPALIIAGSEGLPVEGVEVSTIVFECVGRAGDIPAVVAIGRGRDVSLLDCGLAGNDRLIGAFVDDSDTVRIADCRFRTLAVGILALGRETRGLVFASNAIDLETEGIDNPNAGIVVQRTFAPCRIVDNLIRGAAAGVIINDQPGGVPVSFAVGSCVEGNSIMLAPVRLEDGQPVPIGIDVAADGASVCDNRVDTFGQAGIRLKGADCRADRNSVELIKAAVVAVAASTVAGIMVGYVDETAAPPVLLDAPGARVCGNIVKGYSFGIAVLASCDTLVEGNRIMVEADLSKPLSGLGVAVYKALRCQVIANAIAGAPAGVMTSGGAQPRIDGNVISEGAVGIVLFQTQAPTASRNRISVMRMGGITCLSIGGRCEIAGNRLTFCGFGNDTAFGINAFGILGEFAVTGNEVMDTGLASDGSASGGRAYGIAGNTLLEALIEGNLVSYSSSPPKLPEAEHRALVLMGWMEADQPAIAGRGSTVGFPVQILGNKFLGPGLSALIELKERIVDDVTRERFERVVFSNNSCIHLTVRASLQLKAGTVLLVGRYGSVTGNQVKSLPIPIASFLFPTDMPGPFLGNVGPPTAGRGADFPVPANAYNTIL